MSLSFREINILHRSWGGPPGPRPTPPSAFPDAETPVLIEPRAGPGGPARTGGPPHKLCRIPSPEKTKWHWAGVPALQRPAACEKCGFVQLGADLIRAFRWHWYRIFFSGLFYIIFFAVAWMKAVKLKGLEFWIITSMYIFVLAVNLVPFLENLGRYLAPAVPFFWIIFYQKFNDSKNLYLLLPLSILVVLF